MATAIITIRDTDEGRGVAVEISFKDGFDETSAAHTMAAQLTTELSQEEKPND